MKKQSVSRQGKIQSAADFLIGYEKVFNIFLSPAVNNFHIDNKVLETCPNYIKKTQPGN